MKKYLVTEDELNEYTAWRRSSKHEWSRLQSGIEELPPNGRWLTKSQIKSAFNDWFLHRNLHKSWDMVVDELFGSEDE